MADRYFATAPQGMTDLLAAELLQLGAVDVKETRAGAEFEGTLEMAYRACLWSRLANRILMPLASFPAETPEALYDGVRTIDWSSHLGVQQTLAVDANVSTGKITHSHYAALKVKDAIVDSFSERGGERPSVDVEHPDIRVNCYIHRDQASLYLDLSGTSLHQRNYRLEGGQAPLKENLAAALLLRSRWPEIAANRGAFVDLMCGSGTLVIEAALMAADIAPGLNRPHYGFLHWQGHQRMMWERLVAEARYRRDKGIGKLPPLIGFDHDRRVLALARQNADRAGLGAHVTFVSQDLHSFRHDFGQTGLMLTNPPYGRRLADSGELPALYKALGDVMKTHLKGWQGAVFTEDQALGKHIGIRANKLHTLYNGAIVCKLIHFSIEEDQFFRDDRLPRRIAETALSDQAVMFRNRLDKNLKQVRKWAQREQVSCYRIYDADLPDYAAAIDLYHNAADPDEVWACVQEYEAPATIDPQKARIRTRELVSIVQTALGLADDHLFYKTREKKRGDAQYTRQAHEQHFHTVQEGAARLLVNFTDYLDTGLFLDHRPLRARLFREAKGKTFLNLFAYTGAATVQAALGGAVTTTTVDMSRTYIDWTRRNLELNSLGPEHHHLIQADCVTWLPQQKAARYDLILLDPPTFSNSARMDQPFDVQKDHVRLIREASRLLRPGGTLYFSTNLRHFKLAAEVREAFNVREISSETIPFDFKRRQNIHHCWTIAGIG
jgi:23S rRNA (guanine2445-N2)-methyltransferase / 23S rRNA (guanine2069-N7)-methyltransferase